MEIEQLQSVAQYWGQAPLSTMAYDPEMLETYPTPWEMISENDWCRNSVAIGMEFTLRLAGWDSSRLKIRMIRDYDISDQKLIVEIDEQKWLNYDYNCVAAIPSTRFEYLETWGFNGKIYQKI